MANFSESSTLLPTRKAKSGRNTSLAATHERIINLVAPELTANASLPASSFRKKKAKRPETSAEIKRPKYSKSSLYLNPLIDHPKEAEPHTPTFEDPMLVPFGNSTPSSPHQNTGIVKLITSL